MALSVDLDEALGVKVRVALRRRERGVAEKLLDGAEVRAGREEMRRERVPDRVRRGVAGNRRRPHGEEIHVLGPERGRGPVPEDRREKRREAREIRAVRGPRMRRDAALVSQVAVERRNLRGEGDALYDDFFARLRTSATSALISSAESFFSKEGIFSCPFVIERTMRASSIVSCHFAFVRSRAFFFRPSSVWPLPLSPWQTEQNIWKFSERSSAATRGGAARTAAKDRAAMAFVLGTDLPPGRF